MFIGSIVDFQCNLIYLIVGLSGPIAVVQTCYQSDVPIALLDQVTRWPGLRFFWRIDLIPWISRIRIRGDLEISGDFWRSTEPNQSLLSPRDPWSAHLRGLQPKPRKSLKRETEFKLVKYSEMRTISEINVWKCVKEVEQMCEMSSEKICEWNKNEKLSVIFLKCYRHVWHWNHSMLI